MDLLAALALVMVLEGLVIAVFARSLPELLAEIERMDGARLRLFGIATCALGAVLYIVIRGGTAS
jgi:uncharacterized protein YjeT (DUF2065 family)